MAIIINRLIDCSLHERPRPTTHEERHPLGQVQDTFWMSHTELGISGSLELSWSAASFNPSLGWDAVRWQRNPLSVTPSESESEIVANGKAKLSLSLSVSFIHSFTYLPQHQQTKKQKYHHGEQFHYIITYHFSWRDLETLASMIAHWNLCYWIIKIEGSRYPCFSFSGALNAHVRTSKWGMLCNGDLVSDMPGWVTFFWVNFWMNRLNNGIYRQ